MSGTDNFYNHTTQMLAISWTKKQAGEFPRLFPLRADTAGPDYCSANTFSTPESLGKLFHGSPNQSP
jgi:hypothetical protein